jgi:hypothetical protein
MLRLWRRLARADLEDVGNTGCADVSTARCIRDRSLFPVPRPRSPSDLRLARRPESARPALEPNLFLFACSRLSATVHLIKSNSKESEADPPKLRDRCPPKRTLLEFDLGSRAVSVDTEKAQRKKIMKR